MSDLIEGRVRSQVALGNRGDLVPDLRIVVFRETIMNLEHIKDVNELILMLIEQLVLGNQLLGYELN